MRCGRRQGRAHNRAKREFLEGIQMSFEDTVFTGAHFDSLINLLFEFKDLVAQDLADLLGTTIMTPKINTGKSPPMKTRAFRQTLRQTPEEKKR